MKYCYIFTFLFFVVFQTTVSQNIEDELKFKHYTSRDGLSQRSIIAMLQSKKGYLWFGTRDGLNKFDGKKFKIYRHYVDDSTSLSNNNIHAIYQDTYENLWIGTQNGLNKFNPSSDNFRHYKNSQAKNSIADNNIWGITQIENYLYVATINGLSRINIETDEVENFRNEENNSNTLSNNSTRSFLKTKDGKLWVCNIYYIDIFDPIDKTFIRLEYPKQPSEKIFINDRPTLFQDSKSRIWLGYDKGLATFNLKTKKFEDYKLKGSEVITSAVRSICEDLSGNLWIGAYTGLYILNPQEFKLRHITNEENRPSSLSQNSIYKIIRDSRGDIWIGTWAAGINYYNRDNQSFKQIAFGKSDNTLNYKVVSGIAEDANGNLWIGTEGGGLNFLDRKTKKFTFYTHIPGQKNTLNANNVKAVIRDRNNNLWIGMHDGGVNFLDLSKKPYKFESIDFPESSEYTLRGLKVLSLLEDFNGNIWIGTLTGGVIVYNVKTKKLKKIDDGIRTVMCITESENPNEILIGGDNGLEKVDINTHIKTKIYVQKRKEHVENEALYINSVFIDNFNNYWIGTEGRGLYKYNPKRNEVKNYGIDEGIPSDIIYGVLSDNNGNLWVSTNYGISRLNIQSNLVKNFNYSDGLQGNEFNYGSYFKTSKQELFFGGTNGLTYFNPSDIQKNTSIPQVDIFNFNVNNAPYLRITDSISKIELSYNQNNFDIDFSVLSFTQPEKNQYAYKLEGYDQNWHYLNNGKAIYTNVKHGNYVFKIIGSNNDGVWNTKGDSITIIIKPPLWRTWWAYCIYALFVLSISAYIRNLIIERIRQKKELEEERLEKERIEETNKMKLKLFTDVSHEFRTPLTLIVGPLERMIAAKMGDAYVQSQHEIMNKNAKVLLQLINQILDFRKNESGKLFLQASKNNIVPFIKEVKQSFKALAEEKNVNYQFNASKKNIEVWFDTIKLKKILFNLISNAFKFTKDNNDLIVNVTTKTREENSKGVEYVVIEIINFVSVIPESHIKLIFDRFYQLDYKGMNMGSGIGLSLTKSLVELHKGFIEVKSSSGEGTCFSVFLRLGKAHLTDEDILHETDSVADQKFLDKLPVFQNSTKAHLDEIKPVKEFNSELQSVLVVEDNADVREFVKNIFIENYNVFLANNGKEAYTVALENKIDVIISDVNMPEMNGFELCEKIKTTLITSHIPVILLTAKTSQDHKEKGYSIGANTYITKPFKASILEIRVSNLLKTRANLIKKFKKDIVLNPKELTVTSKDELFLQKAIKIVEENITNPDFNTGMFVDLMGMSRTVLYAKLKALTGQNLSTFIRIIKLKRAGQLISKTDMNISEIAYQVGFNDLKYFRKCFKEFFKVLPSQYRDTKS